MLTGVAHESFLWFLAAGCEMAGAKRRRPLPNGSCVPLVSCRRLSARNRQDRHYFHGFAWEDHEVRMVFEELRGGFVGFRPNDRVGSHLVAYIFAPALSDLLGLAERSTHADDGALVFFDPPLPCGNSLAFLCSPLRFGEGVPCHHFCAGFTAEEN